MNAGQGTDPAGDPARAAGEGEAPGTAPRGHDSIADSVLRHLATGRTISRNTNISFDEKLTFGQRLADRVAEFGGSWAFILIFLAVLVVWTALNILLAARAFDPYPFIFLNLMLSMLAAIQAPVIMMSQNRQAAKDRLSARHDYEVNLKAEIEIMALHEKLDRMRDEDLRALIIKQEEQIALLTRLLTEGGAARDSGGGNP